MQAGPEINQGAMQLKEPLVAGQAVTVERESIPIADSEVTPQMVKAQQDRELGGQMMQASAEISGVPGQRNVVESSTEPSAAAAATENQTASS